MNNQSEKRKKAIEDYVKKYLPELQRKRTNFTYKPIIAAISDRNNWKLVGTKVKNRDCTQKNRPTIGWIREYECGYDGKILAYVHTDITDKEIVDTYIDYL